MFSWKCQSCGKVMRALRTGIGICVCGAAVLLHPGEHPHEDFNPFNVPGGRAVTVTSTSTASVSTAPYITPNRSG